MKKAILNLAFIIGLTLFIKSCYTYAYVVGDGAQTGIEYKKKNHYFIYGLAQGTQSNAEEMAGGAKDYDVTIQHTFVDGLINAITFGIYTPTTTTVRK